MRLRAFSTLFFCASIISACSDGSGPPPTEVKTAYVLNVRFFGEPINPTYQAAFQTAVERVKEFIVGPVPPESMAAADMEFCTGPGSPDLNEIVQGLLIFAQAKPIDGPGGTLAQAGPCYIRSDTDFRTVVGLMQFDSDDLNNLSSTMVLDVITHEMLHVVGLGSFWDPPPDGLGLITGSGQPGAGYTGPAGIAGCRAVGGTISCASSVPVEDCVGVSNCGVGQREAHWKETTFGRELMTAFLNSGPPNPLSLMTIRSFEDLGYTVNTAAADPYTVPLPGLSAWVGADGDAISSPMSSTNWERPLQFRPRPVRQAGTTPQGAP